MKFTEVLEAIKVDPSKVFDSFDLRVNVYYTFFAEEWAKGLHAFTLREHDFFSSHNWAYIPLWVMDLEWEERTND